jgi:RimJ/RimL family protein N-acetyltransferase
VVSGTDILAQEGNLAVVRFAPHHIEKLVSWLCLDPKQHFLISSSLPYPCGLREFDAYFKSNCLPGKHEFFSVIDQDNHTHIGHFEIKNISQKFSNGTLAHVVLGERSSRGRGLGKLLVRLMTATGFGHLTLDRIGLAVHTSNTKAVAAYVRGGFAFEGVIRDVLEYEGEKVSLYQMGILRNEWCQSSTDDEVKNR